MTGPRVTSARLLALSRLAMFFVASVLVSVPFGFLCFVASCSVDMIIAEVIPIEAWTFSSLLGPALAVHWACCAALVLLAGFSVSYLLVWLFFRRWMHLAHPRAVLVVAFVLWILRIPLPLRYSLFYFTTIRY